MTFYILLDIISSSKQRNTKQHEPYRTGGTDHRKHNELPHNLRKRGTDHQTTKSFSPLIYPEVQEKVSIEFLERKFADVKQDG